jgi:hypothetical protein
MRIRKKFTQRKKFTPRARRPKEEQAKERERMAEALAAYHGPVTKCPPGSARDRALSASARVAKGPPSPVNLGRHVRRPFFIGTILTLFGLSALVS